MKKVEDLKINDIVYVIDTKNDNEVIECTIHELSTTGDRRLVSILGPSGTDVIFFVPEKEVSTTKLMPTESHWLKYEIELEKNNRIFELLISKQEKRVTKLEHEFTVANAYLKELKTELAEL